ncbi:hypothetical protein AB0F93_01040 [Micromonospora tulbaghiae]|uniref:hypothetical protein n=1 Tax=Micromonospora tulbaghiae TaxID=479978 RepID=UPI003324FFE0
MSVVISILRVMSGDGGRSGVGHPRSEGVHEQFAIGGLVYDVAVEPTGDDRVSVTLTGCDDDGQLITSLTGVMPPGALSVAARLLGLMLPKAAQQLQPDGDRRTYRVAEVRERHPRAYERWTTEDEQRLLDRYAEGATIDQLAAEFGRNTGGIVSRLQRLGAVVESHLSTEATSIYDELGRVLCGAPPALRVPDPVPSRPGKQKVIAAVDVPDRNDDKQDGPVITVTVGSLKSFESVVELLMQAGAHGQGNRRFVVHPPLSPGQIEALQDLDGYENAVKVSPPPGDSGIWEPDQEKPDPEADFPVDSWWNWQNNQKGNPVHRPPTW